MFQKYLLRKKAQLTSQAAQRKEKLSKPSISLLGSHWRYYKFLFADVRSKMLYHFQDFHWRSLRSSLNSHLQGAARSIGWNWNRGDTFCFNFTVHNEPLLQSSSFMSPLWILVGVWDPDHHHEPKEGRLLLDQSWPTILRVVCKLAVTAGNRTSGTWWCHGTLPWYGKLLFNFSS